MSASEHHPRRLYRLRQVKQFVPFGTSWIYALEARGDFPKRIQLGPRAVAWVADEIEEWVAERVRLSRCDSTPPKRVAVRKQTQEEAA
jgi:prophage regulatory protein